MRRTKRKAGDASMKKESGENSFARVGRCRLFLISALTLFSLLLLTPFVRTQPAPSAEGSKSDSVDRCGNSKAIRIPVINPSPAASTVSEGGVEPKERSISGGPKGTAYFFLGSLCPCTDAHKQSIMELMSLAPKRGIKLVAVFPNRGESVELVEHFFEGIGFKMDYIIDSTNRWVRKFDAAKTPQVFLVNAKGRVVYSGPIDDSVENLGQVKNAYLKDALLDLAEGRPVAVSRAEGSGCWIVRSR